MDALSERGWAADGILKGVSKTVRHPGDIVMALRIGAFINAMPRRLERYPLDALLKEVDLKKSGRSTRDVSRISRIRQAWLASPLFRNRNTCYVRAFTLYRFLDAGSSSMAIHFGVEPGVEEGDRLRGHAWVTLNGELLEAPEPVIAGRVKELYSHRASA